MNNYQKIFDSDFPSNVFAYAVGDIVFSAPNISENSVDYFTPLVVTGYGITQGDFEYEVEQWNIRLPLSGLGITYKMSWVDHYTEQMEVHPLPEYKYKTSQRLTTPQGTTVQMLYPLWNNVAQAWAYRVRLDAGHFAVYQESELQP